VADESAGCDFLVECAAGSFDVGASGLAVGAGDELGGLGGGEPVCAAPADLLLEVDAVGGGDFAGLPVDCHLPGPGGGDYGLEVSDVDDGVACLSP
jgi:hypothetical protein